MALVSISHDFSPILNEGKSTLFQFLLSVKFRASCAVWKEKGVMES